MATQTRRSAIAEMRLPLKRRCLEKGIVHRVKLQLEGSYKFKTYIGASENSFKSRFYSHKNAFRYSENKTKASLGNYIWEFEDNSARPFTLTWSVLNKASAYRHGDNKRPMKYNLCLSVKLYFFPEQ